MLAPAMKTSAPIFFLLLALTAGCAAPRLDPAFDPYRSLAEVVAVLQNGVDADLYRFEPPLDVSGENVFRASLARLARYYDLVPDPGYRTAIRFAQARARERLLDFQEAAKLYGEVAQGKGPLAQRAAKDLEFAARMAELTRPLADEQGTTSPEQLLLYLAGQRQALRELLEKLDKEDARACLALISIERLDVREREFLWRTRALFPGGSKVALDAARQTVRDHVESRRVLEHSMRLGDMYAELARSYISSVDPAGFDFDAAYARNLIQSASRVYAEVAAVDGRPEREEARAALVTLEALVARIGGSAE